jgi:uncharacterized repeat protein (TIGR03803 family)
MKLQFFHLVLGLSCCLLGWMPGIQAAQGNLFTILGAFTKDLGLDTKGTLINDGTYLYGTAKLGGAHQGGTVFRVRADGSEFKVLKSFAGLPSSEGEYPQGGLVLAGKVLYGTTSAGGDAASGSTAGTVFRIGTDGSGFQVLRIFNQSATDGSSPSGTMALVGSTLYGTTRSGGLSGRGTVFKIGTDGAGYQVLHDFGANGDARSPDNTSLIAAGGMLFGTTGFGGLEDKGSVYRLQTDGSGYQVLKSFTGKDGSIPLGGLVLVGDTLYGTTRLGGASDSGTVFSLRADGTSFQTLKHFAGGDDGFHPGAGLAFAGGTLFGTTQEGGASGAGTIFRIDANGTGHSVIRNLSGTTDGFGPFLGAPLIVGSTLYGTTTSGGPDNAGAVFRIDSLQTAQAIATPPDRPTGGTVVFWGQTDHGTPPEGLDGVVGIAQGRTFGLALKADSTVVAWSIGNDGEGNVPAGLSNVVAVAAGRNHALALKADGTVVAWGKNDSGQCDVPPGLTNAVAVSGGFSHSMALRADGTVVAWGNNFNGQCNVPTGLTGVVKIAAQSTGGFALRANGTLVGWGSYEGFSTNFPAVGNISAQFRPVALRKDGTVFDVETSFGVAPAGLAGVVSVDAGSEHVVALRNDGRVVTWGSSLAKAEVLKVPDGLSNVVAISSYERGTLALRVDDFPAPVPPQILVPPAGTTNLAGSTATMMVVATGTPPLSFEWHRDGVPVAGQTSSNLTLIGVGPGDAGWYEVVVRGAGSVTSAPPARLTVLGPPVITGPDGIQGVAGIPLAHTITATGEPTGFFASGLPPGLTVNPATGQIVGAPVYGGTYQATLLATNVHGTGSRTITLQIRHRGRVVEWGLWNQPPPGLSNVVSVAGGAFSSLALLNDGTVRQWGDNAQPPVGLTDVAAISAGFLHYLALRTDGTAVAWGNNAFGETSIPKGATNLVAVAAGDQHSLALRADGTVVAWGRNDFGQTDVPANLGPVVAISARSYYSLALQADGTVRQWGSATNSTIPASLTNAVAISAGIYHRLAMLPDRSLVGWGESSKLGFPANLTNVLKFSAGNFHSIGLVATSPQKNTVVVWGQTNGSFGTQFALPPELSDPSILVTDVAAGHDHNLAVLGEIEPPAMPLIIKPPADQPGHVGNSASFFVSAFGSGPLHYQWWGLGQPLAGETNATLVLSGLRLDQAGPYHVVVSNPFGTVTSAAAQLAVSAPGNLPKVAKPPQSQTVGVGTEVLLSVTATGTGPLGYRWQFNGSDLGVTNATLRLMATRRALSGEYSVVVSDAAGSVTSSPARLRVLVPQRLVAPEWLADGGLRLRFGDQDGGSLGAGDLDGFEIQASSDLSDAGGWTRLTNRPSLEGGRLILREEATAGPPRRFYRVIER